MSNGRMERGAGRVAIGRVPYPVDSALAALKDFAHCILIGAKPPVAFFGYPGKPSTLLPPGCAVVPLATPGHDLLHALDWLAAEVGAHNAVPEVIAPRRPAAPTGALTPDTLMQAVGALLPENAIVCDESVTTGRRLFSFTDGAPPHDYLQLTGGSIGLGLPLATGAAIACPDRKVLSLEADGSGMYTLQALWTQARENLDVTTVICANRAYAILRNEMAGVQAGEPGQRARDMLSLDRPALDWVALARGMGVEGARAATADELVRLLAGALGRGGPFLIEAVL
jgi:acetolactate synthase-1/2/3 large subunit